MRRTRHGRREIPPRLLRQMSSAIRDAGHSRGRRKLAAVIRYLSALNRVTAAVLSALPERMRKTIEADLHARQNVPRRPARPRNRKRMRVTAAHGYVSTPPSRHPQSSRAAVTRERALAELAEYIGTEAALRILQSVPDCGEGLRPRIISAVGPLLGGGTASCLARQIVAQFHGTS